MAFTLCTSGSAVTKAGLDANVNIIKDNVVLNRWSDETEGYINSETRKDWLDDTPKSNFSGSLSDVASSHIAMKIVNYDLDSYPTLSQAQTILDVNADIVRKGIAFLKDDNVQENME